MDNQTSDPGVRGTIDATNDTIVFRELRLDAQRLAQCRPFDQVKSDEHQPIRVVVTAAGERVIMQGNHRVYGAQEDGLASVGVLLYDPEQWETFTEMPFQPGGTQQPQVG